MTMAHYGLAAYGMDIGAPVTPNQMSALATYPSGTSSLGQPVIVGGNAGIQTPYGGGNVQGRVSAGLLALAVVGIVAFYVQTKGIQL